MQISSYFIANYLAIFFTLLVPLNMKVGILPYYRMLNCTKLLAEMPQNSSLPQVSYTENRWILFDLIKE